MLMTFLKIRTYKSNLAENGTPEKALFVIFTSGRIRIIPVLQNHISNASGRTIPLISDGWKVNGPVSSFNSFIYLDFVGVRV